MCNNQNYFFNLDLVHFKIIHSKCKLMTHYFPVRNTALLKNYSENLVTSSFELIHVYKGTYNVWLVNG